MVAGASETPGNGFRVCQCTPKVCQNSATPRGRLRNCDANIPGDSLCAQPSVTIWQASGLLYRSYPLYQVFRIGAWNLKARTAPSMALSVSVVVANPGLRMFGVFVAAFGGEIEKVIGGI